MDGHVTTKADTNEVKGFMVILIVGVYRGPVLNLQATKKARSWSWYSTLCKGFVDCTALLLPIRCRKSVVRLGSHV
jgi:hypothetical protein